MCAWLQQAWEEFYEAGGSSLVEKAFQRCGMLNACDGSDDHLIKVPGCDDYSIDGDNTVSADSNSGA